MKTVKVRIAVAVDPSGHWASAGWQTREDRTNDRAKMEVAIDSLGEGTGEARYWVEAELPIPEEVVVDGVVSVPSHGDAT